MRFSFILASLTAAACAAPAWHQGPVMADDDNLMERRDVVRVQVVQAHTSRFTNIMITKITRYAADAASDVQGFLSESFRGAVADGSGEVMTIAYGKKASPFVVGSGIGSGRGKGKGLGRHGRHRHRISLLGFRNRLAVFILAFSLVLAVACSYLRRVYIASLQEPVEDPVDSALAEKALLSRSTKEDETRQS
ncbi:hypothetical protein X797_004963 [Metarhizium robertsii]|uniref:Uncharacterized protein n=2 Tax=Metarhizium robertsii TaxID=568076 RepID=E9EJ59_METRA|nr:uncharacterized protein MAA_00819 [Metarhizium robertsii ARSEF 23]EFZ03745.1 hypothetical protein MAA_00819 [Metarhizium robertsii ARSEF 23]EXV02118.1 hypothetical protein X797_004963 [Metarhizium robertsii]